MPEPQLPADRVRLFTPGRRVGWMFRDPHTLAQPFTEPPPPPKQIPVDLHAKRDQAQAKLKKMLPWALKLFGTAALLLVMMGGCTALLGGRSGPIAAIPLFVLAVGAAIVGGMMLIVPGMVKARAGTAIFHAQQYVEAINTQQQHEWAERKHRHEQQTAAAIAQAEEWGSVQPPMGRSRLDVIGGSLWGWEAFLTVHGASLLSGQPVQVVDFSRELVSAELASFAAQAGLIVRTERLPDRLSASGLCQGLPPQVLVEVLVEAMHGGADAPSGRADRSLDHRILSALADALGEEVTIRRLAAGLRVLLGQHAEALSATEHEHITEHLFSKQYQEQAHAAIARMEAYLHPLSDLGVEHAADKTPLLTVTAIEAAGRTPATELLTELIVQDLTHRVAGLPPSAKHIPAIIVAGADDLTTHHLERLSDACERRHVPLTLLFRHLRETSLQMVGGGAVCFMRLGNHQEATAAADFIGRHHRFVLSTITKTLGGEQTHTTSSSEGQAVTEGTSTDRTQAFGATYDDGLLPHLIGRSRSDSTSGGTSQSTTRNWESAKTYAEGTNWSQAEARQRVYEYAVEPTVLQSLPDYAVLLAETSGWEAGQMAITPADCNPAIVRLPKVSLQPLPVLPQIGAGPADPPSPIPVRQTNVEATRHPWNPRP